MSKKIYKVLSKITTNEETVGNFINEHLSEGCFSYLLYRHFTIYAYQHLKKQSWITFIV
jgi:hypothetical protein